MKSSARRRASPVRPPSSRPQRARDLSSAPAQSGKTQNANCRVPDANGFPTAAVAPPATTVNGVVVSSFGVQQLTVNAAVIPYLALYPTTNLSNIAGNTATYNFNNHTIANEDQSVLHLDHTFSQRDSLHGTLLYDTASLDSADQTNTLYDEAVSRRTTASVEEVHSSPTASPTPSASATTAPSPSPQRRSLSSTPPSTTRSRLLSRTQRRPGPHRLRPHHRAGRLRLRRQNAFHYNSYQLYDDATYSIGKHTISFGGAVEYDQNNTSRRRAPQRRVELRLRPELPHQCSGLLRRRPPRHSGRPSRSAPDHLLRLRAGQLEVPQQPQPQHRPPLRNGHQHHRDRWPPRSLAHTHLPAAVQVNSFFTTTTPPKELRAPRRHLLGSLQQRQDSLHRRHAASMTSFPLNYTFVIQVISSAPSYLEGRVTDARCGFVPQQPLLPRSHTCCPRASTLRGRRRAATSSRTTAASSSSSPRTPSSQIGYIGSHGVHQLFTPTTSTTSLLSARTPAATTSTPALSPFRLAPRRARPSPSTRPSAPSPGRTTPAAPSITHCRLRSATRRRAASPARSPTPGPTPSTTVPPRSPEPASPTPLRPSGLRLAPRPRQLRLRHPQRLLPPTPSPRCPTSRRAAHTPPSSATGASTTSSPSAPAFPSRRSSAATPSACSAPQPSVPRPHVKSRSCTNGH